MSATGFVRRFWGPNATRLILGDCAILCLLGALVVAASLRAGRGHAPAHAEVSVSGRQAVSLDLGRDAVHDVRGVLGVTRIEVRARRVRVLSSPCPRQVCRHGGWIARPGEVLVCVPNGVVIRLVGEGGDGGPDAVTR
ncbi:MAG TPA: NusG domain II-containing protein [bacterium]